jgi:diaminopimelate epimerase
MKLQFTKMSGAGNDFVVIDNRSDIVQDGAALAKKLCDRRWGIGADGLLLLQSTKDADYRMMYYNADGSYGGMCGNGGRCIARYAVENGIAGANHSFEALGYRYKSSVGQNDVVLSMKDPSDIRMNIVLRVGSVSLKAHFINTGSPHVVIPIGQLSKKYGTLDEIPVEHLGRKIRYHRLFKPDGTNVNFIKREAPTTVRIRTYERGVEAETLACGTGSIASAVIASRLWKVTSPVTILPSSGVSLEVGFKYGKSKFSELTLRGPAITTFRGEVEVD